MPAAFSSHSGSSRELPSAFSKSRERGGNTNKEGEWSVFGKRAVSPGKKSANNNGSSGESASVAKFIPKNSIFAHIEAALRGEIPVQEKQPQEKWGQSALKRVLTAEKEIASPESPPEKTYEELFPTLKAAPVQKSTTSGWGKQSIADKMRQKLQEEEEERQKKELEAEKRKKEAEKNKVHSFSAIATSAFVYDTPYSSSSQYYDDDGDDDDGYYDEADEY
jgi:hypothetical protein